MLFCLDAVCYKNVTFILWQLLRQYNLVTFLLFFLTGKAVYYEPMGTRRDKQVDTEL